MRRITWRRDGFWITLAICISALVLLTVVLYAVPRPTTASRPTSTVESIFWTIVSGNATVPAPWFSVDTINQSGPLSGFPFDVTSGGSFNDSLVIVNILSVAVPVCSVSVSPPLYIVSTDPAVPFAAEAGEDNLLVMTILVHADAGANVVATGELVAGGCPLPP